MLQYRRHPIHYSTDNSLPVQDHLIKGESLYCAHLAVLAQTKNLKKAILACTDEKGVIGGIMDDGCSNIWHPTIEGAFTYLQDSSNIPTETDSHADNHGESGNNEDIVPLDQNNDLVNKFHEEKYCCICKDSNGKGRHASCICSNLGL